MGRVQDQVAIVTGGANGIGRACAKIFVEEGARVVIGDIDAGALESAARALTEAGGEVTTVLGDVSEEGPAAALVAAAVERFGRVDILVNNVGRSRYAKIWEMSVEDWDFADPREPARGLPLHARRRPSHDAAAERPDRLHLLGGQGRLAVERLLPRVLGLRDGEGRLSTASSATWRSSSPSTGSP
jgi:hypothetical protein